MKKSAYRLKFVAHYAIATAVLSVLSATNLSASPVNRLQQEHMGKTPSSLRCTPPNGNGGYFCCDEKGCYEILPV